MIPYKRKRALRKKDVWVHVILWSFYAILWFFMSYNSFSFNLYALLLTLGIVVPQMILAYANVYVFIPRFLSGKKRIRDVFAFLAIVLTMYLMVRETYLALVALDPDFNEDDTLNSYLQPFLVVIFSYFPAFILLIYESLKKRNTTVQLESEKVQTELKFLRGQINPHFLFNTLNSIYHLIPKDPLEAQHYMMVFSDMLKYQLYDTRNEFVPLTKELDYIKHYASMEKLRKGKNLDLHLNLEPAYYLEIPGLTLLTLTENAFKHVSNRTDAANVVHISLAQDRHSLRFAVSNTVETAPVNSLDGPSGIGLENIKRRLELYYRDRFTLHTRRKEDYFEAELVLNTATL